MNLTLDDFPLPGQADAVVVAEAPGRGPQFWAGAPAAVLDEDGTIVLAYRVRHGEGGGDEVVIARSDDGERFAPVLTLRPARFFAAMVERPALVRLGDGWRLFLSLATPGSRHWWVGALDAETLEELADAEVHPAFPGDEETAVKDPIVRRRADGVWEAWLCCHHLDVPGAEDRMSSAYATSEDGWEWTWHGTVLRGREGAWDARGARLTTILGDGRAAYDGRASEGENWFERTGLAVAADGAGFSAAGDAVADVRYLEALALPGGGHRIYYEARLEDETHELRTELIA